MRFLVMVVPLLGCALGCSDPEPSRLCDPASTRACTCDGGARNGVATCGPEGALFGACDCSEVACPPKASQRCEGDVVFDYDACGNRETLPSRTCICPCGEGAASCAGWDVPPLMTPDPACTDATACLVIEHVHCVQDEDGWWKHGNRLTNTCDVAVRCYVYGRERFISEVDDGYRDVTDTWVYVPPWWPQFDAGQSRFGWSATPTEEECRSRWDATTATEVRYHVCARADDPGDICLPAFPVVPSIPPDLHPVCRDG